MENFPPNSSRSSGRTTTALKKAIELAKAGYKVQYECSTGSHALNMWSMLVELSKEETSFVVMHRRLSFPSGGYVDVESSAWPMPVDTVVIYDHYTVEVELDRIDREIEKLLKERDFVVDAGLRGFD